MSTSGLPTATIPQLQPGISNGYVAFLDILGYKSLLTHNPTRYAADIIQRVLFLVPEDAKSSVSEAVAVRGYDLNTAKHLVISDSVLIWQPRVEGEDIDLERARWLYFLNYVAILVRRLFNEGLPVRAAVSVGEYFIEKSCFAGLSIVEAYQACNNQEWCGALLTETATRYHQILFQKAHEFQQDATALLLLPYAVPLKEGRSSTSLAINWIYLPHSVVAKPEGDMRTFVLDSFLAHNKGVSPREVPKAENTELFCRHVLLNVPVDEWIEEQRGGAKAARLIVEAAKASAAKEQGEATLGPGDVVVGHES